MDHQPQNARPADFLAIAALDRVAWADAFVADGEHVWRVWCEFADVLLVRRGGEALAAFDGIAGVLVMFPTTDGRLFLHKIMVHPACRGEGLGTLLMAAALARATVPVLLTVDPRNERAVALYRKQGFAIDQHVEGYYRPHEHRYLMVYTPPDAPAR